MQVKAIKTNKGVIPQIPEGLVYESCRLDPGSQTYTISGIRSIRGVPYRIRQLPGLILLARMGKRRQINEMVQNSGSESVQIYWEYAPEWERLSPLVLAFGRELGMDEQALDEFFLEASKIS